MELIILGSSAAIPVRERNLASTALKYKNELLLFDCGEDIQRNLIEAGLKLNKPLKNINFTLSWGSCDRTSWNFI